ncbi:MAG: alpha-glucosidase [Polyangiaceae bacterium]|nr:alpha-glucosidase [Polyangiaceae bacterium]
MGIDPPDWTRARQAVVPAAPPEARPKDLFRGGTRLETAIIQGVPATRLAGWPRGARREPVSFALDPASPASQWKPVRRGSFGDGLVWRQEAESRWVFERPLAEDERCLGLGELYRGLDRRGKTHWLFTTDDPHHTESSPALYQAIPFVILERGGLAVGWFLDSPAPQRWDLGTDLGATLRITLLSRRGFQLTRLGPAPLPAVVGAFTCLTGRTELPPRWSLGHQQSRWSYATEREVRQVARELRRRRIPTDTVVIDIDYMEDYQVFTIDQARFPRFARMIGDLRRDGFRVVTILDPGVKRDDTAFVHRRGRERRAFCRDAKGEPFVGRVWAGPSCFPDFLREDVRAWWGEEAEALVRLGVAGIWNDMNEPSAFDVPDWLATTATELPRETDQRFLQEAPEGPTGHLEVRSVYGSQMARAAWDLLRRVSPDERPFVLSRSGYAGMQRFGAVWLGDNTSWFEHLRMSIPMLLSMGLSGVPFAGADVGGFGHDADGELIVRWYQLGIFYPFFRNHCAMGQRAQEPWAFGEAVERHLRRLIEVRYRLLPYLESLFVEHAATGAPILRPLFWHAPEDREAREIDDQFFFGPDILVAPILERARRRRSVYFPAGRYFPFDGGPPLGGGRRHSVEFGYDAVPAFVREGTILPLVDPAPHTDDLSRADLTFRCYGGRARGRYREDDGLTLGYQRGEVSEWELRFARGALCAVARQLGFPATGRRYFVEHEGERTSFTLPR